MARTRTRSLRWAGGLTAVTCTAALSAIGPLARAVPEGRIHGAGRPGTVSGSYLVTLKEGTRAPSVAGKGLAERYGARISHTYGAVLNGCAVRASERQAGQLAADPRVASVAQDTRVAPETTRKNPPSWGLDRVDQPSLPLNGRYTAPGSAGDGNGHGTHVAGTVAGSAYGVAEKAEVVSVRVLDHAGAGTTAQAIAGIDWVTRNARKPAVANLSLGGAYNAQLDAAVRTSIASGVTHTVAAGNDGLPAGLSSPAGVRQAITVGATDREDARAGFSNFGSALDLFAPGVSITSTSSRGDRARATRSGTSMASPHAAGAAALHLADHRKAMPAQVSEALVAGAVSGRVSGRGPGSPNKLLQVPGS
ncbi:S8 family peptidase [Streptomyces sp. NPDC002779]|uniref:S8 family peptidase n=1 Tax=Streptomyces sp. NPDC002779 TaxID=3364664 RepID=UPI00369B755E